MKSELMSIAVEQWPIYADDGGAPNWRVHVRASKSRAGGAWHLWSTRLGRFTRASHTRHLNRGSPQAYRDAVAFMRDFCSKVEQQRPERRGQVIEEQGHEMRCSGTVTYGDASRAQESGNTAYVPDVPRDTSSRDRDTSQGQGHVRPEAGHIPIPESTAERIEQDRARFASDPRFAAWEAMR